MALHNIFTNILYCAKWLFSQQKKVGIRLFLLGKNRHERQEKNNVHYIPFWVVQHLHTILHIHVSKILLGSPHHMTSLVSGHSFQKSTISRDMGTAAKFTASGTAIVRWQVLGLDLGLCLGASSLVVPGTFLWSNRSSPVQFWALPSQGHGAVCLMVAFLILFVMSRSRHHLPQFLSALDVLFLYLPRQPGESW